MKSPRKKTKPPASKAGETSAPPPAVPPAAPPPVPEARGESISSTPELAREVDKTEAPLNIPPLLLEGDAPAAAPLSGPGQRYAVGQGSAEPSPAMPAENADLPEAYGTKKLHLTARDPHWVYAYWDMTREQLNKYNSLAAQRHLILRLYENSVQGDPIKELHVHPESRNWFVNIAHGGTPYVAVLGYYSRDTGQWTSISTPRPTLTPPDKLSDDLSARFETVPPELPLAELVRLAKSTVAEFFPLMEILQYLRSLGMDGWGYGADVSAANWTIEQERALAEVLPMEAVRRSWIGSMEVSELMRPTSVTHAWSGAVSSFSSGGFVQERKKNFWFSVNAELLIYGATEPGASVTLGGQTIQLHPDGSFSFRFALPDGEFNLPITAVSADQSDRRSADMRFTRSTVYHGEVESHPQPPELSPPMAQSAV